MTNVRHIAIVEDDDMVRAALSDLLRSAGHRVSLFASADNFLAEANLAEFAGVVADVQMPGLSGFGLARHLVASGPPVILMTAQSDHSNDRETLTSGAVALLMKPFDPATLFDQIEKHFV